MNYADCIGLRPTKHERAEWSRCANAMYGRGRNDLGHFLSANSAKIEITSGTYDLLQAVYRAWLTDDEPKS